MKRKKKRNKVHINESWLLPYSDMLTLLVALFIVLFAMSEVDVERYKELSQVFKNEFSGGNNIFEHSESNVEMPAKTPIDLEKDEEDKEKDEDKGNRELEELKAVQERINSYIKENDLTRELGTKLTNEGLMITISNDVSFDSASAEVKPKGEEIAKEISKFLYSDPPHQIVISGHTDDRPIHNEQFASNWELSVIRAVNFMKLVLKNDDLDPEKFSAKGYGEHQPAAPNNNDENRRKNRRVEVLILPNHKINTDEL
ncbi:flagellar motor protein MotB [Virgibacillus oceani]|uniref:Flagellar motor protein MotB n=1 Tax=Virgibacillus oceani TaxID=1479511 RepID=A0A917HHU6_9BACI|nr:flagellar motor protein MotB [Virgibacillus oceani]GGG80061.1 flagellar motor protein MotB [Virgibacillus oceani]